MEGRDPQLRPSTSTSPSLEDCLKLLRGERDEQKLAGLLIFTKSCSEYVNSSIRSVYDAIGIQFLERLLRTGLGKGNMGGNSDNHEAYLQLSVAVLSAFCRVPEITASKDMLSKVPLVLEIMTKQSVSPVLEDCYEFLYLVSRSSEDGITDLFKSGGLKVVARQMHNLSYAPPVAELLKQYHSGVMLIQSESICSLAVLRSFLLSRRMGSHSLEISVRLVYLILSTISLDSIVDEYASEISDMVAPLARQFELSQNALKFELLHLLSTILSAHHSVHLCNSLRKIANDDWPKCIRNGVMDILQNRVAPDQKLQALVIAESMVSVLGEGWLVGEPRLPQMESSIKSDRCLFLVLESSRVEVSVLLNQLAYLKYEASSSKDEAISVKQKSLAIMFSLVEKVIKLISDVGEHEGGILSESTLTKAILGLNETVGVVLEFLNVAKEHGQTKGDDLLASVRVVGSYLAEAPFACKEKVKELLVYMLSIEGEDEQSPFFSVCFLLPLMCQMTMKIEGSKVLAMSGAYKAVVECLIKLISPGCQTADDNSVFLACDTIMNLLLKREQLSVQLDEYVFIHLLKALTFWGDGNDDSSIVLMASSICSLILDGTSEQNLLRYPEFDRGALDHLSKLIAKSLATRGQGMCDDAKSDADLHEIIIAGYSQWADRFPHVRLAVET